MMAVAAGLLFVMAASLGPRHGVLVKLARRRILAWQILADDVVAVLYRIAERPQSMVATRDTLQSVLLAGGFSLRLVLRWLLGRGEIERDDILNAVSAKIGQ